MSKKILLKRRNPMHAHPLLRKSSVHGKSKKAQRLHDKRALKREWHYQTASCAV